MVRHVPLLTRHYNKAKNYKGYQYVLEYFYKGP